MATHALRFLGPAPVVSTKENICRYSWDRNRLCVKSGLNLQLQECKVHSANGFYFQNEYWYEVDKDDIARILGGEEKAKEVLAPLLSVAVKPGKPFKPYGWYSP